MSIDWKLAIKQTWIAGMIAILLLGLGSCLADPACSYTWLDLLPVAIVLSFPAGVVFLAMIAMVVDPPSFYPPLDFSLIWLGAFSVGYLQWFWILPKVHGPREFTRLGLVETYSAKLPSDKTLPTQRVQNSKGNFKKARTARILH